MNKVINQDSRIASLKAGVRALDAKTDKLNEVFVGWALQLEGVRVPAFVDVLRYDPHTGPSDPWSGGEDRWQVGWSKVGNVWQMAARKYHDDIEPSRVMWDAPEHFEVPVPLTSAPRGVRILAAHLFDEILSALGKALDRYNEALDTALVPQTQIA